MKAASEREPAIDALRVIAVTMVVLMHTTSISAVVPGLRTVHLGLWLGVDLFMLISGWLLGGQLLRAAATGTIDPVRFYVKRWFRTLPAYDAMLVLLFVVPGPFQLHGASLRTLAAHALFAQTYAGDCAYGVSWSLCVEEHFYLCLPLLVLLLTRHPRVSTIVAMLAAVEVVAFVGRIATWNEHQQVPMTTHLRCEGLFVGLAFAWLKQHRPAAWRALAPHAGRLGVAGVLATLCVMASIAPGNSPWLYVAVPTLGTLTLAPVLLAAVHEGSAFARFDVPGLETLGALTYSIYLVHDVLPPPLVHLLGDGGSLVGAAWRFLLVAIGALALHGLVEKPFLRLRARVLTRWPRPWSAVATCAAPASSTA